MHLSILSPQEALASFPSAQPACVQTASKDADSLSLLLPSLAGPMTQFWHLIPLLEGILVPPFLQD